MKPMFTGIDCLQPPVADLDAALAFYRDKLGLSLVWRKKNEAAGLRGRDRAWDPTQSPRSRSQSSSPASTRNCAHMGLWSETEYLTRLWSVCET